LKSEISLDTGFKAVRPQLAINILHNHMLTMVILMVLKNVN